MRAFSVPPNGCHRHPSELVSASCEVVICHSSTSRWLILLANLSDSKYNRFEWATRNLDISQRREKKHIFGFVMHYLLCLLLATWPSLRIASSLLQAPTINAKHPTSDMNSTTGDTMTAMMMTPWLHFGGADYLIFKAWQPMSNGAIAGACIALVAFCILDRWIAALRRQQEFYWASRSAEPKSRWN